MISEKQQLKLRELHADGHSVKDIAETLQISQPTVRAYLKDKNRGVVKKERKSRAKLLEQADQNALKDSYIKGSYNCKLVHYLVNKDPVKYGLPSDFKVSLRTVRRYMDKVAPKPTYAPEKVRHFECAPGQQLQIDFTYASFIFPGENRPRKLCVFEAVYPWSHKSFFTICPDLTQASWLRGIYECILRYGVPQEILCDNDRSLVTRHTGKELQFNTEFFWFCEQFDIDPRACVPGRPQTKGAVERAGRFFKDNCLCWVKIEHPEVSTIEELNDAIQEWNETYATDERVFEAAVDGELKKLTVRELFEIESKKLKHVNPDLHLTIATKTLNVSKSGALYIHGLKLQFDNAFRNSSVTVSVCSNGKFLVTNLNSLVLHEGTIPKNNLMKYKLTDKPDDEHGLEDIQIQPEVSEHNEKEHLVTQKPMVKPRTKAKFDPLSRYTITKKEKQ